MNAQVVPELLSLADVCRYQVTDVPRLQALLAPIQALPQPFFAPDAVCVSEQEVSSLSAIVAAAHRVLTQADGAAWHGRAMPAAAQVVPGPRGVFFGYDFHLTPDGPKLIEINTNAGGVFLAGALAAAQALCCDDVADKVLAPQLAHDLRNTWFTMFHEEWRLQRGAAPFTRIAIVDDTPEQQFLYPEFVLFADLFRSQGLDAQILEPQALTYDRQRRALLDRAGNAVPMIYNRLTDFYLDSPDHAAIRAAFLAGDVVLTPHPRAYAYFADKRNLVLLSDRAQLLKLDVGAADVDTLVGGVPATVFVTPEFAPTLWAERKQWFFKPSAGYGGKAAYRGDKLTRGKWEEILASTGTYIAQRLAPPRERVVERDGKQVAYKFDLRAVVYNGQIQLLAARLFHGQTTNFRAPGSGFAPVIVLRQDSV